MTAATGEKTMGARCTTLAQLESYERQYLIASGWHRRQANRGEVWVAPEGRFSFLDVDSQDVAVCSQKQADKAAERKRIT